MKKSEYKKHIDRIMGLGFNQKKTMRSIENLNHAIRYEYNIAGIDSDGAIILDVLADTYKKKRSKQKDECHG